MSELQLIDKTYIANTYARFPVEIVSGSGSEVYDVTGKRYIDMGSGIGVTSFGIADKAWAQAVTEQLGKVQHMSNLYYTEPCARLAKLLCERTGMKKVFFGNSGAEANECAIKAARKWAAEEKGTDYSTVITLWNSFHGRTLTTLAATGQSHYHELYQPLTPGFVHVHAEDLAELEAAIRENKTAAVLLECVQGEGGVVVLSRDYVDGAARLCKAYNVLLIIDEVQTGNGRTGKLYSYMHYDLQPDLVSTAKGLGGGLPLGACLMGEKVQNVFGYGDHGSTFGGNPVCCAGALSILARMDEGFFTEVGAKAEKVRAAFADSEGIEEVTGIGLMIGLKTTRPAADVVKDCIEKGVLCLTAKDRVRLLPALNIPEALLMQAAASIREVCKGD